MIFLICLTSFFGLCVFMLIRNHFVFKVRSEARKIVFTKPHYPDSVKLMDKPTYDELVHHPKHWLKFSLKSMYPKIYALRYDD